MKTILSFILFIELISFIFSQVPVWNLSNSAINLLEKSNSFKYTIYSNSDQGLNLIKEINKTNDDISQKNYVEFNESTLNTTWEGIQQVYKIDGTIYVCQNGRNHLSYYSNANNEFKELIEEKFNNEQDWDFTCNYLESGKNIIFASYLSHNDNNIYGYRIKNKDNNWFKLPIFDGHLDIVWSNDLNPDNNRLFFFNMLIEKNDIEIGRLEVTLSDKDSISMSGSKKIKENLDKTYEYFDEQKNFYWITNNDNK